MINDNKSRRIVLSTTLIIGLSIICLLIPMTSSFSPPPSFDDRSTLSRSEARDVYDGFATNNHKQGGKDADSGYGGPAVTALLELAHFETAETVLDYGCGQGKLAELILSSYNDNDTAGKDDAVAGHKKESSFVWRGVDQSPKMVAAFQKRCCGVVEKNSSSSNNNNNGNGSSSSSNSSSRFGPNIKCTVELLESGEPLDVNVREKSIDRFVSTYCLDLLSEEDMYKMLDLAETSLDPQEGLLLVAGITWGYRDSIQTFVMTAIWEFLYRIKRRKVGGCRPQCLRPYLEAKGWRIQNVIRTMPNGYPWMASEVISARPPFTSKKIAPTT